LTDDSVRLDVLGHLLRVFVGAFTVDSHIGFLVDADSDETRPLPSDEAAD